MVDLLSQQTYLRGANACCLFAAYAVAHAGAVTMDQGVALSTSCGRLPHLLGVKQTSVLHCKCPLLTPSEIGVGPTDLWSNPV